MGVRRFNTSDLRFLQQDILNSALGDLALGLDPLTQNRFALAGGNPAGYHEWDGHYPVADGKGGAVVTLDAPQKESGTTDNGPATGSGPSILDRVERGLDGGLTGIFSTGWQPLTPNGAVLQVGDFTYVEFEGMVTVKGGKGPFAFKLDPSGFSISGGGLELTDSGLLKASASAIIEGIHNPIQASPTAGFELDPKKGLRISEIGLTSHLDFPATRQSVDSDFKVNPGLPPDFEVTSVVKTRTPAGLDVEYGLKVRIRQLPKPPSMPVIKVPEISSTYWYVAAAAAAIAAGAVYTWFPARPAFAPGQRG